MDVTPTHNSIRKNILVRPTRRTLPPLCAGFSTQMASRPQKRGALHGSKVGRTRSRGATVCRHPTRPLCRVQPRICLIQRQPEHLPPYPGNAPGIRPESCLLSGNTSFVQKSDPVRESSPYSRNALGFQSCQGKPSLIQKITLGSDPVIENLSYTIFRKCLGVPILSDTCLIQEMPWGSDPIRENLP